jgi:ferredoxin
MTRVVVDRDVCMSSGVCEMEAPEVFELDADGVVQVRQPADTSSVATAVRACPTGALSISSSSG